MLQRLARFNKDTMFTGKPMIGELGYAFLFRNYRADQGKWQTSDPLGYPDGWNNFAYVNNGVTSNIDYLGGIIKSKVKSAVESKLTTALGNAKTMIENLISGYKNTFDNIDLILSGSLTLSIDTVNVSYNSFFGKGDVDCSVPSITVSADKTLVRNKPKIYDTRDKSGDISATLSATPGNATIAQFILNVTLNKKEWGVTVNGITAVIKLSGTINIYMKNYKE